MKPPQPPTPIITKPPIHKPGPEGRPLTTKLMARVQRIIDQSKGKLTRQGLADDIGKGRNEVAEYLGGFRSAPNSEITLRMLAWADKHTPKKPAKK